LDQFAQTNAAGMRVDADAEFSSHQENRQILVDAPDAGSIDLDDIHRASLEELFEHHPVVSMFARGHGHRRDTLANGCVPQNVIRARRLLDPCDVEFSELPQPRNGRADIPALIGIDGQCHRMADGTARNATAANVIIDVGTHFDLDRAKAIVHGLDSQACELLV